MPPLQSDICHIKNGEEFFNWILQEHPGPGGSSTEYEGSSAEYDGDLLPSIFLGSLVLPLTRIRFKAVMKICYVINCIKNRFGLDVFKTRNIMNFDCSLNFGKVYLSHSGITYMTYLQPHSSRNEGKKKKDFFSKPSGSQ